MDHGVRGHLHWFDGSFYDWMKSKAKGANISLGNSCCETFDGGLYHMVGVAANPKELGLDFRTMSYIVAGHAHEVRHVDGPNHSYDCHGTLTHEAPFDLNNLPSNGVEWWLANLFLNGTINVGYSCLNTAMLCLNDSLEWVTAPKSECISYNLLFQANEQCGINTGGYCDISPPLVTMPLFPAGPCVGISISGRVVDSFGNPLRDVFVDLAAVDGSAFLPLPYSGMPNLVLSSGFTDASGEFSHLRVFGDSYKLFLEPADEKCLRPNWFNAKPDFGSADIIAIADNQKLEGILARVDLVGPEGPVLSGGNCVKDAACNYSAERKDTSYSNPILFRFNWKDGTDSCWLPLGQKSASKVWTATGTYPVTAQTKCVEHGTESLLSEVLSVNVVNPSGYDLSASWTLYPG